MSQSFHGPVKPLQAKCFAIKEQDPIVVLVVLASALKSHLGFSRLVILEFHCDPVVLAFVQRSGLALVNGGWLKFICRNQHSHVNRKMNSAQLAEEDDPPDLLGKLLR